MATSMSVWGQSTFCESIGLSVREIFREHVWSIAFRIVRLHDSVYFHEDSTDHVVYLGVEYAFLIIQVLDISLDR